ncbi:MAG: hypothetical protein P1U63_04350 [Coxiellaceae bacterium]|nr:hypothetical protein [Coxiellaceae bacterium]
MPKKLSDFQIKLSSLAITPQTGVAVTYQDDRLIVRAASMRDFLNAFKYEDGRLPLLKSVHRQLNAYGFNKCNKGGESIQFSILIPGASDAIDAISQTIRSKRAAPAAPVYSPAVVMPITLVPVSPAELMAGRGLYAQPAKPDGSGSVVAPAAADEALDYYLNQIFGPA